MDSFLDLVASKPKITVDAVPAHSLPQPLTLGFGCKVVDRGDIPTSHAGHERNQNPNLHSFASENI